MQMQASSWSWSFLAGFGFCAAVSTQAANSDAPSSASVTDVVRHTCAQSAIANVLRRPGLYFGSRPTGRSGSGSVQPSAIIARTGYVSYTDVELTCPNGF